nr:membrane lipoprotein lipid attachment site-containing protein [Clostridia bacterium]
MKKMLSLILAVLMLTSFAACAGESADNTANDTTAQDTGTTAETTTAVQYEAPEVNDYEGYEYRIGINDSRNKDASIIIAEEANGEAFNDAVYERNEKISELY